MPSNNDIVGSLREHSDEIRRFGVKSCSLFGTAARGEMSADSDVDLLVEFSEPTFDHFMDLAFFLEELLGRRVELVCPEALRPSFRNKIASDLLRVA